MGFWMGRNFWFLDLFAFRIFLHLFSPNLSYRDIVGQFRSEFFQIYLVLHFRDQHFVILFISLILIFAFSIFFPEVFFVRLFGKPSVYEILLNFIRIFQFFVIFSIKYRNSFLESIKFCLTEKVRFWRIEGWSCNYN